MKNRILVTIAAGWILGCTPNPVYTTRGGTTREISTPPIVDGYQSGVASYYAHKFHGRKTANGEIFDMNKLTAAHLSLAFNTKVRVVNLDNSKSVIVRINDRGPYAKGRIIDLSLGAAREIDMIKSGTANVKLEILSE